MKIMVATADLQGQRKSDFFCSTEGEIVRFASECERDRDGVDGPCGCRRGMAGIDSQRATTTLKVVDSMMTKEQFTDKLRASFVAGGWGRIYDGAVDKFEKMVQEEAFDLLRIAASFPVGAVLEKRGGSIQVRTPKVRRGLLS